MRRKLIGDRRLYLYIYLIGDSSYIMQCLKGKELSGNGCETVRGGLDRPLKVC